MIERSLKITGKPQGFISIIAIGIFALLMVFAISLQMTIIDTINNLKNSQNQDQAEAIANSAIRYLQWKTKDYEAGLNDDVTCVYESMSSGIESKNSNSICDSDEFISKDAMDKKVTIDIRVKGRSEKKLRSGKSAKCDKNSEGCYVTPIPGTGDAGENCKMYTPSYVGDTGASPTIPFNLANASNQLDQLNYSCNWNKLSFGSSQSDRVAVPLYYEKALLGKDGEIMNPFLASNDIDKKATKLIVKLRTPCKPCAEDGETPDEDYQRKTCAATVKDETVCADEDRYVLDAKTSNDIIVQWLINGECQDANGKTETCGIMPIPDDKTSALYESAILGNNSSNTTAKSSFEVIDDRTLAHDSNNFPDEIYLIDNSKDLNYEVKLPYISKPLLTLFLSKPLLTEGKHNIPYLEYQVLTDQSIGNSKSSLEASIVVEGNAYKKTLTKQIKVPLIDFAIHN